MKVLNVIWAFGTGGIGKLFLTYAALGEYDLELQISSVCIDLQNCEYDRKPLTEAGIRVIAIKNRKDMSWVKRLGGIAREVKPDVVFCHGFNGPVIIKLVACLERSLRVLMVCTYHGLYNPPTEGRRYIADAINKLQAWMYKRFARTVVLVAEYSGLYLLERKVPKSKLEVVYNGIVENEPALEPVVLKSDGVSIGMAGRLDAIKGLNFLIKAIPEVRKRVDEKFHIYIIGDGPEEEALRNLARELGVEELICFEGYQDNVPAWLKAWDIFCLPSLQENHSIALLEAMRAGKAIVCTSVGGNPETVEDGKEALVVPARNSEAIADALVKLIESESLRKKMGHDARERFLRNFTEDIMKKKLCEVLKNATINQNKI